MKKIMILMMIFLTALLVSCEKNVKIEQIYNGSFEEDLNGWTSDGDAFTTLGLYDLDQSETGETFGYIGNVFFYGKECGLSATGTLTSKAFTLGGNGKIGFLIGAGKNTDLCYVELIDAMGNTLVRRSNKEFEMGIVMDELHRVILDGSKYIGQKVRVRLVDNDAGDDGFNYLNVDDFIVSYDGEEEKGGLTNKATKYIVNNMNNINSKYRHTYHAMAPIGWGNDPNGLSYYNGKGHLFFQFNPYSPSWDTMYWGHYTTEDFIKWKLEPVALAPDQSYDSFAGCFSGSAIEYNGLLYLLYTAVSKDQDVELQQQAIAVSSDGINFKKYTKNPVISKDMLPEGFSVSAFRDPYVYRHNNAFYAFIGASNRNVASIIVYKSLDMTNWSYVGEAINANSALTPDSLGIYECPSFAVVDGVDLLITSPQQTATRGNKFQNYQDNAYVVGKMNFATGAFAVNYYDEIDNGTDFYAPQLLTLPDGRVIMIAWMSMWGRSLPTTSDGWVGAYTLPRELHYYNNHLYQTPVEEIKKYRQNPVSYDNIELIDGEDLVLDNVNGNKIELEVTLDLADAEMAGVKLFQGSLHETLVYYDKTRNEVIVDRSNSGIAITGEETNVNVRSSTIDLINNTVTIRMFLDVSSLEVFVNNGYSTLTTLVYPDQDDLGISFFTSGGNAYLKHLIKYDILL